MKTGKRRICALAAALLMSTAMMTPASAAEGRLYNQYDPYWKTVIMHSITGTESSMYTSACGIFSFCNAIYGLNSTEIDAVEFAEWACSIGAYRPGNGGTYHYVLYANVEEGWAERAGFHLEGTYSGTVKNSKLIAHLKSGGVAVAHVYGHFIAITGYDEAKGLYHVIESACSKNRLLAADSWVDAAKLSDGKTKVDWFALLSNTKAPGRASVKTDYLHSVGSPIDFTLDSDVKATFGLGINNAAGERIATYYSRQAALSCVQHYSASVDELGLYSAYTTSFNTYGHKNSKSCKFLVYDTAPQKSEISCEQPLTGETGVPMRLNLEGDLAESYTVEITDQDGVKVVQENKACELCELSGTAAAYDWVPKEPGSYTARVIMHNDIGDLESEPIELYASGNVTVQLDAAGGTAEQKSVSVPYAGTYGTLPDAKRLWYAFDGWYTQASGGEQITPETEVTNRRTHSIYAQWNPLPEGDLNADRITDLQDAVLLSRVLHEDSALSERADFSEIMEYADADRNGSITMQDLSFVLDILYYEPDSAQ